MKSLKITVAVVLAALFMAPVFNGCKKGEEDPGMSLKSRKARLAGEWEMIEGTNTSISGTSTETYTYNNGTLTYTGGGASVTGTYTWVLTIEKTGSYTVEQSETFTGNVSNYKEEGFWFFSEKNKDSEYKGKEVLFLQSTKRTYTSGGTTNIYSEEGGSLSALELVRLASKEMIVHSKNVYTSTATSTDESDFTFEKK
ncbi:MAG: hypothetical protein V2A54_12125 [Bacteroidota bacterium]